MIVSLLMKIVFEQICERLKCILSNEINKIRIGLFKEMTNNKLLYFSKNLHFRDFDLRTKISIRSKNGKPGMA